MMGFVLTLLLLLSCLAAAGAPGAAFSSALTDGAREAFHFCFELGGVLCFWGAVLELAERCGLSAALARRLLPLLRRLFPAASRDRETLSALTENLSANLLGLGNAATPAGIRAVAGMKRLGEVCRDELCLLVVLNTASLQLLPSTIAAVRAAAGAAAPFDIVPAVWFSSAVALAAGLSAAALLRRVWP